ncbi:MAG: hypothetical protein ABJP48_08720 [Erythrobacter sp.]
MATRVIPQAREGKNKKPQTEKGSAAETELPFAWSAAGSAAHKALLGEETTEYAP